MCKVKVKLCVFKVRVKVCVCVKSKSKFGFDPGAAPACYSIIYNDFRYIQADKANQPIQASRNSMKGEWKREVEK